MTARAWRPATADEAGAPITRLGGRPSWSGPPRWPVYRGEPLEFVGQFTVDGRAAAGSALLLAFLSFGEDAQSWLAEGGGNAALVEPGGQMPPWVTAVPDADGPSALGEEVLVPTSAWVAGGEPRWIQYDQTPEAAPEFVGELSSFPDERGMITFGDGGVAYLFVSPDRTRARLLWQTT